QKNCVFTIEPGIYFPGKFGIRIEDTVLFDEGVKVLTESSKKLKIIGI
ncbi:MAG: M24 family metallopeptidase, partial [Nanoarchaeota archaeon]|nr:M24 family metallopeptidase [Nanoarchaeota archaeon]